MTGDRIAELEAEVETLKSRLRGAGLIPPSVDLPDADELDQLIAIAAKANERLRPSSTEPDFRRQFFNAVHYLTLARRSEQLNSKFAVSYFLDEVNEWCRRYSISGGTSLRAFVAAAVVSGVKYSPLDRFPFDLELGLTLGDANHPSSAWRDVAVAGKAPAPVALNRRAIPRSDYRTTET